MPKLIQVIESTEKRGSGLDGDPVRMVFCYYTLEGVLLAENDPQPSSLRQLTTDERRTEWRKL